jgi:rubrerythrin
MNGLSRRLRDAERAQRGSVPAWQDRLHRMVDRRRVGSDELTCVLGLPSRRDVLRIGGLGIAGSALLAACGGDDGGDARTDPSTKNAPAATDELDPGPETDRVLLNTALSLEVLAVDAYRRMGELGLVESASIRDAFAVFAAHHAEHRDVLAGVVQAAGVEPFLVPNPAVRVAFVDPALLGATVQGDLVRLAHDLERAAAQTYVHATGVLSTVEQRGQAMAIGAVEARHAAILDSLGELATEKPARYPTEYPLPQESRLEG